jgi:hypothetical protein
MTIFASFKGFKNHDNAPSDLVWGDVKNGLGESVADVISKRNWTTNITTLKFGSRYRIDIDSMNYEISKIDKMCKAPKCEVFRRFKTEYHFIGGKHQGKKDSDLEKHELNQYCIWLLKNTYNEVTIKNALQILKELHNEQEK